MKNKALYSIFGTPFLSLILLTVFFTHFAGAATLTGRLANKTPGGKPVSGIEVTLNQYLKGAEAGKVTARTGPFGDFSFSNLPSEAGRTYSISFKYQEAQYDSPPIDFKDGKATKSIEVPVWDATTDPRDLKLRMLHVLLEPGQDGSILVREFYLFQNQGVKTYIGSKELGPDKRETLRFSLPPGAKDVEYLEGLMPCCVVSQEGGFVDTMDVKPGMRQLIYAYTVQPGSSSYILKKGVDYPTDAYNIFVADVGVKVEAEGLASQGTIEAGDRRYIRLAASDLKPGAQLDVKLSNLPRQRHGFFVALALGGVLLLLSLGFVYPFFAKRKVPTPEAIESGPRGVWEAERQALLNEIADLDEAFERGEISSEEYEKARRIKKDRLLHLLRKHPVN